MSTVATKPQLSQYRDLIRKRAWEYARKYSLDFEDMEAAAMELFVVACNSYDPSRNVFSTHLWNQLGRLSDIANKEMTNRRRDTTESLIASAVADGWESPDIDQLLPEPSRMVFDESTVAAEAKSRQLSADATRMLDYLLSREWEVPGNAKKPNLAWMQRLLCEPWGWSQSRMDRAWYELKNWWSVAKFAANAL